MDRHAALVALALLACVAACSAATEQVDVTEWTRSFPVAAAAGTSRRLLTATSKPDVWDCGACTSNSAQKSYHCPKNDNLLVQALKAHGHASALLFCCGQTLPGTFTIGSDAEAKAWFDTLKNKYQCTDVSRFTAKVENGDIKQSGTVVLCGKGTIFQCV